LDSSSPFVQAIAFVQRTLAFAKTVNTRTLNGRAEGICLNCWRRPRALHYHLTDIKVASVAGDTPPAVAISYGLKAIPQARFAIGIALNNFKLSIPANTLGVNSSRKLTATVNTNSMNKIGSRLLATPPRTPLSADGWKRHPP
jgi:hypothetical protein